MLERVRHVHAGRRARSTAAKAGSASASTLVKRPRRAARRHVEARSDGLGHGSEFVVRLPVATRGRASTATAPSATASRARAAQCWSSTTTATPRRGSRCCSGSTATRSRTAQRRHQRARRSRAIPARRRAARHRHAGPRTATRSPAHPREPGRARRALIAITGWGQDQDKQRAREAGFDQHLTKPVDPDALKPLIARR